MDPKFWHNKKVFLTGHSGFKGSWLSLWLHKLGATVCGFALQPPTEPNLFELANVNDYMKSIFCDIRNYEKLRSELCAFQPDIVIHMAAQSLVRPSYENPIDTFNTNVMGTVHLLEASRASDSVQVILCITSDKCYENRESIWGYRENDAMGGYDPYSASKGCSEIVAAAYRRSFFHVPEIEGRSTKVATARAGNVIGGGDWAQDRLVPDIMRAFMRNQKVIIRNPLAIRPWQHVLEPLGGYLLLLQNLWENGPEFAEGWNFGPGEEDALSVEFIVKQLAHAWGPDANWSLDDEPQPHEAHYLKLDCSKARTRLQWKPRLPLAEALEWTAKWYQAYKFQENMHRYTLNQITRYEELKPL